MRIGVRVIPGARQDSVGGRVGSDEPPVLAIRVRAPAVDGKANRAAEALVAAALGLRSRDVRVVAGERSRRKVLEVTGADPDRLARLFDL